MTYFYDRFEFSDAYREELIEMIRHQTNIEVGGYRLFDGTRAHLMQSPWELADFIFALKRHEQDTGKRFESFLEVGFSAGINNTILHKFFEFKEIVGVDIIGSEISTASLRANLMRKPLTLVCGDSTSDRVLDIVGRLGGFDFIFIDACHQYEFVKKDFHNYSKMLNKGGVIGFHDVDSPDWPGIKRFWEELKATGQYDMQEFVCRDHLLQYGIGMLKMK